MASNVPYGQSSNGFVARPNYSEPACTQRPPASQYVSHHIKELSLNPELLASPSAAATFSHAGLSVVAAAANNFHGRGTAHPADVVSSAVDIPDQPDSELSEEFGNPELDRSLGQSWLSEAYHVQTMGSRSAGACQEEIRMRRQIVTPSDVHNQSSTLSSHIGCEVPIQAFPTVVDISPHHAATVVAACKVTPLKAQVLSHHIYDLQSSAALGCPKTEEYDTRAKSVDISYLAVPPCSIRATTDTLPAKQVGDGVRGSKPVAANAEDDDSYSYFKTRSRAQQGPCPSEPELILAERYFDALKGPELDVLKDLEVSVLPMDKKWPFLLRFPAGCFGICLGLSSQTILWKILSTTQIMNFIHIPHFINLWLWYLVLLIVGAIFATYFCKCLFYFEAVRREFYHPVRINFFFAPWIACMFLTVGVPHSISKSMSSALFFLFMAPNFVLELKTYGEWLLGGEKRLCKIVNPSTYLSLLGNFVGALLAATIGWKEIAIFFWAVGLAHYLVVFVTLYQRLPTAAVLPKELHPVFFLFVAAPSSASIAWFRIVGDFDMVSRISYFIGLFFYTSLVVRLNFFRGLRFSVSWWAYTTPMTVSAIATIDYSLKISNVATQGLAILLSIVSSAIVLSLSVFTILHIFFWGTMFPNDMAIAITTDGQKVKKLKKLSSSKSFEAVPQTKQGEQKVLQEVRMDGCHKRCSNPTPQS